MDAQSTSIGIKLWSRFRRFWRSRILQTWGQYRWLFIAGLWLVALFLGYAGFSKHAAEIGEPQSHWNLIYLTLQLISMNSGAIPGPVGWELNLARFLLPTLAALTAAQAFAILFREQVDLIRLRLIRDHIVICGLSHKGFLLINSFRLDGSGVVVVERDEGNDFIEQCRARGAVILLGDATDIEILRKSAIHRAKALIAVCDDDGTNAEIAVQARRLVQESRGSKLTCVLHVVEPQLYDLLREREIGLEADSRFRLELFNVYDRGAQLLMKELPVLYPAGSAIKAPLHLVIVGLGRMGESLVVHIARTWWENHSHEVRPLRITVVDREAGLKVELLRIRYPRLPESCELVPCEMDIRAPAFQRGDFLARPDELSSVGFFCVCLDDDTLSLYTGLNLLRLTRQTGIPIVVRVTERIGLANLINRDQQGRDAPMDLHAFGLLERTCTPDLLLGGTHEVLAREIHTEYVRSQKASGKALYSSDSIAPWEELPEHLKEANRQQVDRIGAKLHAVGCRIAPLSDWDAASLQFTTNEIELMAQMEHETWVQQRQLEGWSYAVGPKDPDRKTHPDLVSWEALPEIEKEKNRGTVRDTPRFLARAGFQIER